MQRRAFALALPALAAGLSSSFGSGCASTTAGSLGKGGAHKMLDRPDDRGKAVFTAHDRRGTFVLFDENAETLTIVDTGGGPDRLHLPASTFKIPNSLVALETGVAPDETFSLSWDGVPRTITLDGQRVPMADWNRDHDMRSAMKASCVWYYQEIARRVGEARMREKLTAYDYGNHDIGGGVDRFWLDGALRISPRQQIAFLRRLWRDELPASMANMARVRRLIVLEEKGGRTLFGKTGLADVADGTTGWLVGTVEQPGARHHYALVLHGNGPKPVMKERRPMVDELLATYGV